jgi:CSLREA domain-containing protein
MFILSVRRLIPALLLALTLPAALRAAVYVPTKTADTNDGVCDTDCSLREAIAAANRHAGENVVLLHAGTYSLTAAGDANGVHLPIQGDLILLGDGAGRTIIDGGASAGILSVAAGVTVQIQDVTLRNGQSPGAGGAIRNNGVLTLLRTTLAGNFSVAGAAGAGLGGAILSNGAGSSLTITDSAVVNNTAQSSGGGIAAGGTIDFTNVTISGNRSSTNFGGGVYLFSDARGTIASATIAGNSAALQGGGLFGESTIFIGVPPKLTNSIVAGNSAASRPDCFAGLDSAYDLIGNGTGCIGPAAANHSRVGTAAAPLDSRLGALADNGGPGPTLALLAGSPAIAAGNPAAPGTGNGACEAADQRGAKRASCDLGAFTLTTACVPGANALCLGDGRFKVTATWGTATASGTGAAVPLSGDSGYFWFFDPANVEVTVKAIDGCASNHRFWFFASGLTNIRVDLKVTDTRTGAVKTYSNALGKTFVSILDSNAFNTCP